MTAIENSAGTRRRRAGVTKQKWQFPKCDMTPMVDLGFLLIAFFVMTTQMDEPVSFRLNMPADTKEPSTIGESNALTVLLGDNNIVYYYHGNWNDAIKNNSVKATTLADGDGLGKIIRDKQALLEARKDTREGRHGLMLMVKASKGSFYKMVIDAFDEAVINGVEKYGLLKLDAGERQFLLDKR